MPYDLAKIRARMKEQSGRVADPDEFKPGKAKGNKLDTADKYRMFILPPFEEGDKLKDGVASKSMSAFFIKHGNHWFNKKPYSCPRLYNNVGEECKICTIGFELMSDLKNRGVSSDEYKAAMRAIGQTWMPAEYNMTNVFFLNTASNLDALRGRVKYYNAPKSCLDIWESAIMRDNAGDKQDPQAFGIVFDEYAAFAFQLIAMEQGGNNNYKSSYFLHNNGVPVPMIANEDGSPNEKGIELLLSKRINLFSKIEEPDHKKIGQVANTMTGELEDNEDDGFQNETKTTSVSESVAIDVKASNPTDTGGESPFVEEVDAKPEQVKQAKPETKKESKPAAQEESESLDDDDDDSIKELLGQLSED